MYAHFSFFQPRQHALTFFPRPQQGDLSDWGSNAERSDDSSSVVSAGGQSTQSSALGALERIEESEHEHPPAFPPNVRQEVVVVGSSKRTDSFSTEATELDASTSRSGGGARRLDSVSFADATGEDGSSAAQGEARDMGMSLAERSKGGSSPGVSRRCDIYGS